MNQKVTQLSFFSQSSMHFYSALATFEPQHYVVARIVWTVNILLVSGGLVQFIFRTTCYIRPIL